MRWLHCGAAACVLPLLFLLMTTGATAQQDRYWEILTLFGGDGYMTDPFVMVHDAKRDRIIIAGRTEEDDLPVTPDAMKSEFTDSMDGFIAVFNADCSELIYCSYVGGSRNESLSDAILLDDDRLLIVLSTYSRDMPTTGTAWESEYIGEHNTWLAVLSLDTFSILHSGYFGGSGRDAINRALLLSDGSIVITGAGSSTDLPVTPNAFQPRKLGILDGWDAFIAIFDSTLNLTYCSYHGGLTYSGEDAWRGLAETENYIVFAGTVDATDMPVTENAYQKTFAGGWNDAYLVVISKDSLKRVYSTYLGGSEVGGGNGRDLIHEIVSVGNDRLALIGDTESLDFPVTPNAWQTELKDDGLSISDLMIGIFDIKSLSFEELTFLGGEEYDYVQSAIRDPDSPTVTLLLTTYSQEFPLLPPKPEDCLNRGALLTYNVQTRTPERAIPVHDIARGDMMRLLRTDDGRLYFCGVSMFYTEGGPVPVRPTGYKTVRTGKWDVFIGIVHDTPVSVDELPVPDPSDAGIFIHPQPARDELRFIIDTPGEATVSLHDMLGRKLREVRVSGGDIRTHGRMPLAGIVPGVYMLLVRTADDVRTRKVLVTR